MSSSSTASMSDSLELTLSRTAAEHDIEQDPDEVIEVEELSLSCDRSQSDGVVDVDVGLVNPSLQS